MNEQHIPLLVVGGGPAGLAAAVAAKEAGCPRVVVLERDTEPGGILNQCIHNGFGLHYFKEELTGPEYAARFVRMAEEAGVEIETDTMVLDITRDRVVRAVSPSEGYREYRADAVVLAMGCRERTRGAIGIPGTRPAGVFTAGCAQRYLNIEGQMVGRRVVILGSGDIGLIMARRMVLSGAEVLACVELQPYSGGLQRNITQCLEDFGIPLYLSHTVTEIRGRRRVEQVVVSAVDEKRRPVPGSEMVFDCDTLLLSVGLIPENELSRGAGIPLDPRTNGPLVDESMQTGLPGVFACGNAVHVHDLVDFVSAESEKAGAAAARYALGEEIGGRCIELKNGNAVNYTVPQHIRVEGVDKLCEVFFRVNNVYRDRVITVTDEAGALLCRFPREHMAPGEMERIALPRVLLEKAGGDTLTVSCEEVSE
mgnify:CR=1 FL=1